MKRVQVVALAFFGVLVPGGAGITAWGRDSGSLPLMLIGLLLLLLLLLLLRAAGSAFLLHVVLEVRSLF